MSHMCKLIRLTSSPYTKLLNMAFRTFSCQYHNDAPRYTRYDDRKFGSHKCLPGSKSIRTNFEPLNGLPTDVFRFNDLEELGPSYSAGKSKVYKNPEYFAYHSLTFYDMHLVLQIFRRPPVQTGRKP